jgi:BirA family biotin operon repressor/biotin-[acetyl-CoA-carboxylase] ligase
MNGSAGSQEQDTGLSAALLDRVTGDAPFLQRWIREPQVDSTQRLARERGATDGPGLLVIADEQTRGRGRQGRTWFSPVGAGLWMSLVLAPRRPGEAWPLLTSLTALALRDALDATAGIGCGIKWPNDLIYRGRKIAGFLADVGPPGMVALGIGLNVRQTDGDFPAEIRGLATSVRIASGAVFSRGALLDGFLRVFGGWLARFEAGEDAAIIRALRGASVLLGRTVVVAREGSVDQVRGEAVGIGPLGELVVETGSPMRQVRLMSGSVVRVVPPLEVAS